MNVAIFFVTTGLVLAPAVSGVNVSLSLDAAGPTTPNPRLYEKCLGSGHATLTLREDWRDQVRMARRELGTSPH